MQVDHVKEQCQHARCTCEVEPGQPYCSEYCRNTAEFERHDQSDEDKRVGHCGCGHEGCSPQ